MFTEFFKALKYTAHALFDRGGTGITTWEKLNIPATTRSNARIATPEQDKELIEIVEDLSKKAGLEKRPKVIIYEAKSPNATWQHNGSGGTILVRTSLLNILSKDELRALIAHEITHSFQKKTRIFTWITGTLAALAGAIGTTYFAYKEKKDEKLTALDFIKGGFILEFSYYISRALVGIVTRKVNRALEYDADRGALLLTGNLEVIKSEFEKYDIADKTLKAERAKPIPPTSPMEGATPPTLEAPKAPEPEPTGLKKVLKDLYSTHPSNEQRIAHLEKVKKQMDAGKLKDAPLSRYF